MLPASGGRKAPQPQSQVSGGHVKASHGEGEVQGSMGKLYKVRGKKIGGEGEAAQGEGKEWSYTSLGG